MKKNIILILALCIMFVTSACAKTVEVTSTNGLLLSVSEKWQQITNDEDLAYIYGDIDDELRDNIELVLKNNSAYITIEKHDATEDLTEQKQYVLWLQQKYKAMSDDEKADWLKDDDDDLVSSEYKKVSQEENTSDETLAWLVQLNANKIWFDELEYHTTDFKMLDSNKITFLGKDAMLSEYTYMGEKDVLLHFYEVSAIENNYLYTFTVFDKDSNFEKNKSEYKDIIDNVQI